LPGPWDEAGSGSGILMRQFLKRGKTWAGKKIDDFFTFTKGQKGSRKSFKNFEDASSNTLFRVQGGRLPNASRERFIVKDGTLSIEGDKMLYVTFDDEARAIEFLAKRGEGAYLFSAKIDQSFVEKIRKEAVNQYDGKRFPGRPQTADMTKTNDSFGIPKEYFDELLNSISEFSEKR
jgi:hypothetical protein